HLVYGSTDEDRGSRIEDRGSRIEESASPLPAPATENRLPADEPPPTVKSVMIVETPVTPEAPAAVDPQSSIRNPRSTILDPQLSILDLWEQELRAARRKLEPDGALTGATREMQAGLGSFLQLCHEHGVKVGPWRMQHVVPEWTFGEHPTYGAITIAHWVCKD